MPGILPNKFILSKNCQKNYAIKFVLKSYAGCTRKNFDFNFLKYTQRVTLNLCNFVHTNLIKGLANFLTFTIILTRLE